MAQEQIVLQSTLSDWKTTAQDKINANFDELYDGAGIFEQVSYDADATMAAPVFMVFIDATSANITITLPDPAVYYTRPINFKRIDNSAYTVTLACPGGEGIENNANIRIMGYECATLMSDQSNYWII